MNAQTHRNVISDATFQSRKVAKTAFIHTHIPDTVSLPQSDLPSQSLQEFLRLAVLKGNGVPSPEMSKFWIR